MINKLRKLLIILAVYNSVVLSIIMYNGILTETDDLLYAIFAALLIAIASISFIPFTSEKVFYSGSKKSTEWLSYPVFLIFMIAILCLGVIATFRVILMGEPNVK
ncbi:MAG: hypothetical protein LBP89_01100 [Helicobacteraceae bacterium]|jgi:hypothetical protein|nr:hypothetical protein [Helicobacteraceae bacterium]